MQSPGRRKARYAIARLVVAFCLGLFAVKPSTAHEVDQYAIPSEDLVDQGDYWNNLLYWAVRDAVDDLNLQVHNVRQMPLAAARDALLAHLYSHDTLAAAVRHRLPTALGAIDGLEVKLFWKNTVEAPTGKRYGYFATPWASVFGGLQSLPDPRQLGRMTFMRCSLMQVHGTRLGTDKVAHFVSMGYINFLTYRRQILRRVEPTTAMRRTIRLAADGPLGESGILGGIPTGVFSNADMAANYLGMKFYLNLRQPLMLKGQSVPPMVTIRNGWLVLNPEMRPDNAFFAQYISDHLDEVLNPSLYDETMREGVRHRIRQHCREILDYYAGDDPEKRNPEYFNRVMVEYSTYHGEAYGHSGQFENLISVGNTCFISASARRP